jgi:peptidoglycan/LPS O-acetylase OafA/YrhL
MAPAKLNKATVEPSQLRHNTALDGIRGLAILMVLFCHLVYISNGTQTPLYALVRGIRDISISGVDIFFALSGFLITRILVRTAMDHHFFLNFYARRALRIFPLYYGVLFLLFALTPVLHIHWHGDQWRLLTYSNRLFPSSSGNAWNFYYGGFISLVNFWSLHIEEQFYMLWPVFVYFLRTPRRLLPVAACISLACLVNRLILFHHGYSREFLYTSLVTRADSLLIGACLALALLTRLHPWILKLATPVFVSSLFLAIVDFQLQRTYLSSKSIFFPLMFTFFGICATALIAMCLKPA